MFPENSLSPPLMALTQNSKPIIWISPPFPRRLSVLSPSQTLNPQFSRHPPLTFSRRLFLPSVSSIWDAITGGGNSNPREAVAAIRRGMLLFRQADVLGSLVEFDRAMELDPRQKAYLWQRGLSLYYLDSSLVDPGLSFVCPQQYKPFLYCQGVMVHMNYRFEEGAEQFRLDVAQNPNDTEESIWCFLCEARLYGVDGARKQFLEVGRDPRPVMREAYNMFKSSGDPEKLVNTFSSGQAGECFYASLYAGLYFEAEGKSDNAKFHITAACQSPYGQRSDDYMASLAKVHCICRNWSFGSD